MYIRKIRIRNIRSISDFTIEFLVGKESGWHVLIGDNGSGKSTILKAIAMGLLGPTNVLRLDPEWDSWVKKGRNEASIEVSLASDKNGLPGGIQPMTLKIARKAKGEGFHLVDSNGDYSGHAGKGFAMALGPFRRFSGGDPSLEEKGKATPVTPFLSLFREGMALTSTLAWVKDVYLRSLENDADAKKVREGVEFILSSRDLLPEGIKFSKITADGIFFINSNGKSVQLHDLSDGMKSVLAITLELIRQMLKAYKPGELFRGYYGVLGGGVVSESQVFYNPIPKKGVVLIDEIDAHLHPNWQTRIGYWFLRNFPGIQFIVSTHSPLVCRACEKGSIWRLAAPGSDQESGEVTGIYRDRLIYGNVLDAFGTEVFGAKTSRSEEGNARMNRLAELNIKSITGKLTESEEKEYLYLQSIFPTGK